YEGEAELRPIERVRVTGSFTVVTPRVRELSPTYGGSLKVGDALLRRPTHSAALGASYGDVMRSFGIAATYVGKRPDMDFSKFPSPTRALPTYVKVDLS